MVGFNSELEMSSPVLPRTPPIGAQASGMQSGRFNIEDEELDELARSIPCSSPYFTQPTQIVSHTTLPTHLGSRTTQPTQIVQQRTTLHRSSPPVPDTPETMVEVPASSPFQAQSLQRRPAVKATPLAGRLASFMAPAGTAFRAPTTTPVLPRRNPPAVKSKFLSSATSDDDLANGYKREYSSEDDRPMRGEIKPTTFVTRPTAAARPGLKVEDKELQLSDIHDLRLRYLTKQTLKMVAKVKPKTTVLECKNALQTNSMSIEDAINSLIGDIRNDPGASSSNSAFNSKAVTLNPRSTTSNHPPQSWNQTNLPTQQKPRNSSSSPPPSPEPAKNAPPRRRLMQGRRNPSPSPPVFSVSSSHATSSAATTPSSSSSERPSKMANGTAVPGESHSQEVISRQRKLTQGSRVVTTSRKRALPSEDANVITVDSSSDDSEFPDLTEITPKKGKTYSADPELKKRRRLVPAAAVAKPAPRGTIVNLTNDKDTFVKNDESESEGDGYIKQWGEEHDSVLKYLNTCSAEELARMTGNSLKDAQLVVSKRPFKSLADVHKVKAKSTKKSKKDDIGPNVVDKLDTWFKAFDAVTAVISQCEERGHKLQLIMSKWEMDKNGKDKDKDKEKDTIKPLSRLPISKRPALMAEDIALKSYQLFGLNWLNLLHNRGYSGILADDMGLGKTCQVISFIAHLAKTQPDAKPNVIVVPPSTLENWANEFERFGPGIKVFMYTGTDRRALSHHEARDHHVVLTSYSMLERNWDDIEWLSRLKPYAAIYDEGHKLKNPKSLVYQHLSQLPSKWRLVLTGTPVQNNLKELLSLLNFVEPSLFQGNILEKLHTIFEAKVPNKDVLNFAALAKERVGSARTIMVPFILQRRKDEVLELPAKKETLIVVPMHDEQKTLYNEIKGSYLNGKGKSRASTDKGNRWMQLRKAAIHPQLFRRHFTDKVVGEMVDILWKKCTEDELHVQSKSDKHKAMFRTSLLESWDFHLHLWCKDFPQYIGKLDVPDRSWDQAPKVQKLLELVKSYQENGDRCLVFSRFEMALDILREALHFAGFKYCELSGMTPVADRFPEIEKFNENKDIPVFLLTTGAGGTGLNLTAANKIIIFDQSDNPQDDVQASNRAHRIGQTREVEIIRLITDGTVERLIYNSCVKKLMLAACVEGAVADEESVEEECRRLMLLGDEGEELSAEMPPGVPASQMLID
ncbi:SNF2 family N-terminal domain-containing protein [Xylariales sp. AK1849]|nr:SNF2 family N-terminal domain-containing protein [Xylariales sp. AK1849]